MPNVNLEQEIINLSKEKWDWLHSRSPSCLPHSDTINGRK